MLPPYWRLAPEPLSREMAYGLTAEGHPWFGAENPEIEIEMYSDYQCFQCKKMHVYLRKLIAGQQQKIRVIHRHYPMDHEVNYIVKEPFHIGSGKMALIAIYAASKGKFWEMNDLLFEIGGRQNRSISTGLPKKPVWKLPVWFVPSRPPSFAKNYHAMSGRG